MSELKALSWGSTTAAYMTVRGMEWLFLGHWKVSAFGDGCSTYGSLSQLTVALCCGWHDAEPAAAALLLFLVTPPATTCLPPATVGLACTADE